jgi:GMP synthase-like glutamine amidotransferase
MRVHSLQHVAFEGLGSIDPWLNAARHDVTRTRLYLNEPLPTVDQFDWLIIMGGPMGANDDAELAWLGPEKMLIRQSIDAGKRVLGICLGAQLIAAVLGARVFQNAHREIGWFGIQRSPEASQHLLGAVLPEQAEVFHWHGDTFDLPPGAVRLAGSAACRNQAFAVNDNVLALQFHLESTPDGTRSLIDNCGEELVGGQYIQTAEEMLADPGRFDRINRLMAAALEALALPCVR